MLFRSVCCCGVRPSKIEGDVFLARMGRDIRHEFLNCSTSLLHPTSFNHQVSVRQPPGLNKQRQRFPPVCAAGSKSDAPRLIAPATNYRAACVPSFSLCCFSRYWCHVFVRFVLLWFSFHSCLLRLLIPTVARQRQEKFRKVGIYTLLPTIQRVSVKTS